MQNGLKMAGPEVMFSRVDVFLQDGTPVMNVSDPNAYTGQAKSVSRFFPVRKGRIYQYLSTFPWGQVSSLVTLPVEDGDIVQQNTMGFSDSPLNVQCFDVSPPTPPPVPPAPPATPPPA